MKKVIINIFIVFFCCIQAVSAQSWWEKYNDPLLVEYINDAINNNHDYKSAILKVSESRARVEEYFGKELPKLSVTSNYLGVKPPLLVNNPLAANKTQNLFILPLIANYEIDIWGKNRVNTKAQKELLEVSNQDAKSVYIALTTDIASAYLNIIQFDKVINLQKCIIQQDLENFDILKAEYETGLSSYDNVLIAKDTVTQSQNTLTDLLKQRDFFLNELMVLTGKTPENKDKQVLARNSIDNICLPKDIPFEIPSTGIMQRPDILKSEANLRYAKINIDLARKDFLPNINIFGIIGFESLSIRSISNISKFLSGYGALLQENIFNGGQKRAVLKQKKFQYEQLFQNYQSAILTSLQEVNNALYSLKTDFSNDQNNQNRLSIQADNLNLVNYKYKEGLASRLDTIQPQRNVFLIQQEQTRSKTGYLIDSINLYKALGGEI